MPSKKTNIQTSEMRDRRHDETAEVEENDDGNDEEKDLIEERQRPKRKKRDENYVIPSSHPCLPFPLCKTGGFQIGAKKSRRDSDSSVNATKKAMNRGINNFVVANGRLSSRANIWLFLFVSSTIATASFAITSPNALRSGMQHIALLACSLGMFLSFILACSFRHRLLREFLVKRFTMDGVPEIPFITPALNFICINTNQTLEMHLSVFSMFLWCVAAVVILDMENSLAVTWTQVWSSNLYFSTWISILLSFFLVAELITTGDTSGIHPLYYRGNNQVNRTFILLLFSSLCLIAFGASHLSGPLCDGALMETISCRNCIFSVAFAVIGILVVCFHFTIVAVEKTTLRPRLHSVDASLFGFCLAWYTLHAGIVTSPGAAGWNPNIFVSSWICFFLSIYLCIHHIDQSIHPNLLLEESAMKSGLLQYRTSRFSMEDELSVDTTNQYSDVEEDDDAEDFPSVGTIRNGHQQDPLMFYLHAQNAKNETEEEDQFDDNSTLPTYRSHETPATHSPPKNKPVFNIPSLSSSEKAVCNRRVAMNYRNPPRPSAANPRQPSILRRGVFGGNPSPYTPLNGEYSRKESNSSSAPSIDVKQQATDSGSESPLVRKSWLHQAVQDPVNGRKPSPGNLHGVDRSTQDRRQNFNRKDSSKSESRVIQSREAKRNRTANADRKNLSIDLRVRSKSDPDQSRPFPPPPQPREPPVSHKEAARPDSRAAHDTRHAMRPLPKRFSDVDKRKLPRDHLNARKKSEPDGEDHSPKEQPDAPPLSRRDSGVLSKPGKREPPAHRVQFSPGQPGHIPHIPSAKKDDKVNPKAYREQPEAYRVPGNTGKTERQVRTPNVHKISVHTVNSVSTSSTYLGPSVPAAKNPINTQPFPPPPKARTDDKTRRRDSPLHHSTEQGSESESPVPSTSSSTTTTNETPKTNSPEITRHILEIKKQELLNVIMSASESSGSGGSSTNSAVTREGDVSSAEHISLASSRKQQAASRKIWEALEIAGYTGSYKPPEFGGEAGTPTSSQTDDMQSIASSKKSSITFKEDQPPSRNSSVPDDVQSCASSMRSFVTFKGDIPAISSTNQAGFPSTGSSTNSLFTFKGGKPQVRSSKSLHQDTKQTPEHARAQEQARRNSVHMAPAAEGAPLDFPSILKKNLSTRNASRHSRRSSGATSAYSKQLGSFFSIGTNAVEEEEEVVLEPGGLYAC
ncbi:hypothetical protein ACHAXS_012379 [Conticribra weissflogii]